MDKGKNSTKSTTKARSSSQSKVSTTKFYNIEGLGKKPYRRITTGELSSILENRYIGKRSSGVIVFVSELRGVAKVFVSGGNIVRCEISGKGFPVLQRLKTEKVLKVSDFNRLKSLPLEDVGEELLDGEYLSVENFENLKRNVLISTVSDLKMWRNSEDYEEDLFWSWYDGGSVDVDSVWNCEDVERHILAIAVSEREGQWKAIRQQFPFVADINSVPDKGPEWESFVKHPNLSGSLKNIVSKVNGKISINDLINKTGYSEFEVCASLAKASTADAVAFPDWILEYDPYQNIGSDYENGDENVNNENQESDIVRNYYRLKTSALGGYTHTPALHLSEKNRQEVSKLFKKAQEKFSEVETLINEQGSEAIVEILQQNTYSGEETFLTEEDLVAMGLAETVDVTANGAYDDFSLSHEVDDYIDTDESWVERRNLNSANLPRTKNTAKRKVAQERENGGTTEGVGEHSRGSKRPAPKNVKSIHRHETPEYNTLSGRRKKSEHLRKYEEEHEGRGVRSRDNGPHRVAGGVLNGSPSDAKNIKGVLSALRSTAITTLPALKEEREELEKALIHQATISSVLISRLEQVNKAIDGIENLPQKP